METFERTTAPRWYKLPHSLRLIAAESLGSVLLETGRFDPENHISYLFTKPQEVLSIESEADLLSTFERIEEATHAGLYVAGVFGYECGQFFHPRLARVPTTTGWPYAWLGIFEDPVIFDHATGTCNHGQQFIDDEADSADVRCDAKLAIGLVEYERKVTTIRALIAAGDTYQVNLTDFVEGNATVRALELYRHLMKQQPIAYGAYLNLDFGQVLSLSPELFFRKQGNTITARPMKGTARRGFDLREDEAAARALQQDEKNKSEHVMIVDLLRNDLGRVCESGSVTVTDFCEVERYRTLLQMTSTITGNLRPSLTSYELFQSLFPSGSITGAPKLRTMQIIQSLERNPRGLYTGAIGYFGPQQNAQFNVAIRTVVMDENKLRMGVGGGIVADSDAAAEYEECGLKANFLTAQTPDFQLIETMRWEDGIASLDLHCERMKSSAAYFDFPFSNEAFKRVIVDAASSVSESTKYRFRVVLDKFGSFRAEVSDLVEMPWRGCLRIADERTHSKDVFLRHKTTNREVYRRGFLQAQLGGFDEILFANERDQITEAANHNVLFRVDGKWMTPPLSAGVLPGTYRQQLVESADAKEDGLMTLDSLDHATEIALCNAVRGLRAVSEIYSRSGELLWESSAEKK